MMAYYDNDPTAKQMVQPGPPRAVQASPVFTHLGTQNSLITELHGTIDDLAERLASALSEQPPDKAGQPASSESLGSSSISGHLVTHNQELMSALEKLRSIQHRLEV